MISCLIIHGYTGGPYEIDPLVTHLKEYTDWHIEVPVLSGHGRELDLIDVSYDVWLNDADKLLKKLITMSEQVYVIGFSMGGMIAAYLAATNEVDKLILLAPARRYISFKNLARTFGEMIGDGFKGRLNENELYIQYKGKLGEVPLKANVEFMKLVHYTKPFLKKIHIPVLIIQGKRDEMVPFRTAYALEREIGSAEKEVVIFDRSGHHLCLGLDQEIVQHIALQFLQRE